MDFGSDEEVIKADWAWQLDASKESVCRIQAGKYYTTGTGFVVRNDTVAALVTARHVIKDNVVAGAGCVEGVLTGKVKAIFRGGKESDLTGARVLLVPAAVGDGSSGPPDVAVVVLRAKRRFPARPVPCLLGAASAADVGSDGQCTLLHHPSGNEDIVVDPRGQLEVGGSSASAAVPPWVVPYRAATAGGSSGGMLMDSESCRAFAVHVSSDKSEATKLAVLLSVVHARLGDTSPWHNIGAVVHQKVRAFHLPALSDYFVGRAKAIVHLQELVRAQGMTIVASTGLPGVGKSFVAISLAHSLNDSGAYSVVAWLRAESVSAVEADLVALGDWLGVLPPARPDQSRRDQALAVTGYLTMHPERGTLLFFDNAENYQELREYVPGHDLCRCVFTARDKSKFPSAAVVQLDPFSVKESLSLLRLVSQRDVGDELLAAIDLCDCLGHLPLAVHVMAAYVRSSGLGFGEVLERLRGNAATARALKVPDLADYARYESVVGALLLVCGRLDSANWDSLQRLAMVAPDRVPRDLIGKGAETDRLWDLAIVSYPEPGLLSTHRLMQGVVVAQMSASVKQRVAERLFEKLLAMTDDFSAADRATWRSWQVAAPHAEAVLHQSGSIASADGEVDPEHCERWILMRRLCDYYLCTFALSAAERTANKLTVEVRSSLGSTHPITSTALFTMARVLKEKGQYDQALSLYRAVEASKVAALGADHPEVAATRNNMANLLCRQGKYDEALSLYRVVEAIGVAALGAEHPEVADTRHNMANVLVEQGKYNEAMSLYRAVESNAVAALGADHPEVAATRHNMANVLFKSGAYDEALSLYRDAEAKGVAALGSDHPEVAGTRLSIANVLFKQGEYDEALSLYRAVEAIRVAALGADHPEVASLQHNMANVLFKQGEYGEALSLYRSVEANGVAALGANHPEVAATRYHIANVLFEQGKYDEALSLCRAVEAIRVAALGADHTEVAATRYNMANALVEQGEYDEALSLYRVVEASEVAALGADHAEVAATRYNMASVLFKQGKYDEALSLYRAVEAIQVAALGADHAEVAATRYHIANVLFEQGEYDEALSLFRAVEVSEVAALGADHAEVAATRHNMANVLFRQGEYDEALSLYRAVETCEVAALGADHPEVAATRHSIANVLSMQGKCDEALSLYRAVEAVRVAALGAEHPEVAATRHNMANVLFKSGAYDEALSLYRDAEAKGVAALGSAHPDVAATRHNMANVLFKQGEYDEALSLYRAVEASEVAALGADHAEVAATRHSMANVLVEQGTYDEAVSLYRSVEAIRVAALGADHAEVAATRYHIANVLFEQGEYDEALALYRAVQAVREAALGADHPEVATTRHNIAMILSKQGKTWRSRCTWLWTPKKCWCSSGDSS